LRVIILIKTAKNVTTKRDHITQVAKTIQKIQEKLHVDVKLKGQYLNLHIMIQHNRFGRIILHWINCHGWNQFRIPTNKVDVPVKITSGTFIWMRPGIRTQLLV
jgi:hypothetical protein